MCMWETGLFSTLLGTDILLKQTIEEKMKPGERRELPGGKIILRKVHNRGFIFSSLEEHTALVKGGSLFAGLVVVLSDVWIWLRGGRFLEKLGMTLFSAGAASNVFDRFVRGYVVDYIAVDTKNKRLAGITANLGDIYLALGMILTAIEKIGKR